MNQEEADKRFKRWGAWVFLALGLFLVALTIALISLAVRVSQPARPAPPAIQAATTPAAAPLAAREGLTANLWTRASLEYPMTVRTIYAAATAALSSEKTVVATEDKERFDKHSKRRRAVVLDLDETVLNNSPQQAGTIARGEAFSPAVWDDWVSREAEETLPGAVAFTKAAEKAGLTVFYVTNRECPQSISDNATFASLEKDCPQKFHTMRHMQALGFARADDMRAFYFHKQEAALVGDGSDKMLRRERIARDYDIVMLVGDDLGDFMPKAMVASYRAGTLASDMASKVEKLFGKAWFLLPNPTYGSWDTFLRGKYCPGDVGKDLVQCAEHLYPALKPAAPPKP